MESILNLWVDADEAFEGVIDPATASRMKSFIECKTRKTAARRCPWAAVIVKVEGGYMCFEHVSDYEIWKGQK